MEKFSAKQEEQNDLQEVLNEVIADGYNVETDSDGVTTISKLEAVLVISGLASKNIFIEWIQADTSSRGSGKKLYNILKKIALRINAQTIKGLLRSPDAYKARKEVFKEFNHYLETDKGERYELKEYGENRRAQILVTELISLK